MNKITALIDGSVYSASVCDHAAWAAGKTGAAIDLLHVLGRHDVASTPNLSGSIGLGARSALLAELAELDAQKSKLAQKRGRAILEDAQKRLADGGAEKVQVSLRHGGIVETVHEMEEQTGLFVIGKRGEAADFDRKHLGSNLERVVRAVHKPVLVAAREFKPVNRVLIAYDGGSTATKMIEALATHPLLTDCACTLLTAGDDKPDLRRKLEGAAARLKEAGMDVTAVLKPGHAEKVIAGEVTDGGHDMLVMGAYGHSRIRTLIIGSTTTAMIRDCRVPLLLFR